MMAAGRVVWFILHSRGAVAQLARAPALQAGCQGFESLQLHHFLKDFRISTLRVIARVTGGRSGE